MKPALPLHLYTERDWAIQVAGLARQLGWWRYHTYRSNRSPAGFPDETLVRDRLVFLELKTEDGKLSASQKDVLGRFIDAGAEVYVARPRDLDELARVLLLRHKPELPHADAALAFQTLRELDRLQQTIEAA